MFGSQNQSSCQPRLGPDAGEAHPGETVGESHMFQGEGAPSRTPLAFHQGFQPSSAFPALQQAPYTRALHGSASRPAPRASSRQAPHAMPAFSAAPQPSTSRHDSSGSESEASESESVSASRDTASAHLADLIYEVCPALRPLFDAKAPRCEFEAWFGQPEASVSRQRFRMYPRVSEVLEEVAARSESLARRSRPLSRVIPARARAYVMDDDAIFTSSKPVNSAFSQLAGSRSLGARRWGSITFSEMERLERLFQGQLEVTSSSLWLMSGILAMLKRDGFQPSDPALFNSALSEVSAAMSRQARTAAAGSTFVRAKRRESLLAHTTLPVPESQKRDLTVTPGSSSGLFDSELLSEVVAQVHSSSQISSNLALSRSLRRGRSAPFSSSSPLTGPRLPSFARGRPSGKRSSSSSRAGSRKRFRGGKGGGSFFWAFGFPEVGAITFPDPFRRLSVPPLAGLEGQGCGALGGRGAAGRLLSAFPQHPSTFQCSAPNAFLQPHFHQGCCSGGGHLGPRCQGCCRACSSPFSRLLQPSVHSVEDLGVLASSHRPLPSQSLCGRVSLSDGDHSVCSPLGASGGLDGLHRSQGSVSAGACPSCFSSSSALRLQGQRLSVQSSLLWPLHSSAGLHQGHGSCFRHSPFYGDPHEALPRRLARSVILSRIPRAGFADSPPPLSRVGDCRQSSKVQPRSITGCPVSRSDHRRPIFQGFSIARTRLQASVNSRRISVLRLASRELMALAAGHSFFAGSPRSWRPFANAISPALPPPVVGSSGSPGSGVGDSGMSPRPPVVASPSSPVLRGVSLPGVSRPSLLVRRLGRGVGCPSRPSGRFRPVGHASGGVINQRQGTVGCSAGSSPVPVISTRSHSSCLLRQYHSSSVSPQRGRHEISSPQLLGPGDLALDSLHPTGSTTSARLQQSPRGRLVSPPPAPTFRVVAQHDRLSVFKKVVAGPNRLVCHLRQSALFDLLLTIPRSDVSRHRRVSPVLGRAPSLRVSSGGHHSACSSEAQGLHGDGAHSSGSALGPASLVLRPAPAFAGPSCRPAVPSGPPAIASLSSSLPGSPSAQASCLASLQRFTRAAGFSSAVAEQASLARRPSSCAVYQVRWSVYRSWCHDNGHSVSRPTLAKVADFLYWLRFTRGLSVSSLRGYRSVLSAVLRFHLPSLSSDPVIRDLLRSFQLSSAERVLRPPAWDLSKVLTYLVSPAFEPLAQASFRSLTLKTLFLLALATAKRVGELQAFSSIVTFVGADACLSYIPQFVAKSESLTRSIPRSFLVKSLADFAAGLDTDLLLCPVRALRLYLLRARSLSPGRHRLFVSPRRPSRAMSKNAVSFFLREVISAAEAARPRVGSLRAHEVRSVSTSVAFHRNWSVTSVLESATWASSSVFSSFYLRDIQHEYDGLLSRGPFVAAGSRIG